MNSRYVRKKQGEEKAVGLQNVTAAHYFYHFKSNTESSATETNLFNVKSQF